MSNIELNATARSLMEIRAMIKELEAEAESLTDQIKGAMLDRGAEIITGEGWKATWKNVTSSRFDGKAFKANHADLYAAYTRPTTTCRFTLTV